MSEQCSNSSVAVTYYLKAVVGYINVCQQLMEPWLQAAVAESCRCRGWSREMVPVMSQRHTEMGWAGLSFITVIKIMSVLAAGW